MAKPKDGAKTTTEETPKMTLQQLKDRTYLKNFDQIISDLKHAFMCDLDIGEACRYAHIVPDTYYRWLKESDEFKEQMTEAQDWLMNQARANITKAITEGDKDMTKWLLERRRKENYSTRSELTGKDGEPVVFNWGEPKKEES